MRWRRRDGGYRWYLETENNLGFDGEFTRRWKGGVHATVEYGGQEHFLTWTLALPHLLFCSVSLNTPRSWRRFRPRDGKYGESHATFGVVSIGWWVRLLVGNDPLGTHYGYIKGRFGGLRRAWRNREVTLFHPRWVVGKDRYEKDTLDERQVVIAIDRWPGDRYEAAQRIEAYTWRNRFRTKRRTDYWWDIDRAAPNGIPTDPHGKWGDEFGETYGFGAGAPDGLSVDELVAAAPAALAERLESLLKDWPEGLVPREVAA